MTTLYTNEMLRDLYLADLKMTDCFHDGRTMPKVKDIKSWEKIKPFLALQHTDFLKLNPYGDRKIYLWSDIHWGHKNIITYCNRPYPTVDLMNQCLIGNYLNIVKHEDIVIFGGDISFMKQDTINEILNNLPGYKIQIIGNHDMHRDGTLYDLAFDESHLCFVIPVEDHDFTTQLLFTHYPLDPTNVPDNCYNVHGHIHDKVVPGTKHINISVEHTNYAPMLLTNIIQRARRAEAIKLGISILNSNK